LLRPATFDTGIAVPLRATPTLTPSRRGPMASASIERAVIVHQTGALATQSARTNAPQRAAKTPAYVHGVYR
ncbi:MAG: hypothetical protein ACU0CI_06000, partial [Shimia sp.]